MGKEYDATQDEIVTKLKRVILSSKTVEQKRCAAKFAELALASLTSKIYKHKAHKVIRDNLNIKIEA